MAVIRSVATRNKIGLGQVEYRVVSPRYKKRMGLGRTISSGLSLILGMGLCYAAMHYLPTALQPARILQLSPDVAPPEQATGLAKLVAPYWQFFDQQRAFLNTGQAIRIDWELPAGAHMNLIVKRCQRMPVIEVFHCKVMATDTRQITSISGTESFRFSGKGFYHFDHHVQNTNGQPHRVIWSMR